MKLYGGYATAIFVAGWATGGLLFGAVGDRIGRAKTLTLTVLLYSVCTGLSAFSTGWVDFAVYRFVTGLGVGGVFGLATFAAFGLSGWKPISRSNSRREEREMRKEYISLTT